jgi:hypothetical protein
MGLLSQETLHLEVLTKSAPMKITQLLVFRSDISLAMQAMTRP